MSRWIKFIFLFLVVTSAFFLGTQFKSDGKLGKKAANLFHPSKARPAFAVNEHKPFVVIVPSFNNCLWVEKNLRSIFEQKYDNYRVIYINDASTDSTLAQVQDLVDSWGERHRFEVVNNVTNRGAMENIYRAVHRCEPDEIVLVLDGDDWFAHDRVLEKLNEVYADPDVWVTWGSYVEYPNYSSYHVANFAQPLPQSVIDGRKIRQYSKNHWCFSQLRTFYAGIFQNLKLKDLAYEGKFVDAANDVAFFVPVMEMAGPHVQYVPEILYIWNRATPLNDDKVRGRRQLEIAQAIYRRASYPPIKELPKAKQDLQQTADFIIFSYDRPLQLYALLESIEKYCIGIDQVTVIYRSSGEEYDAGYDQVYADFPNVNMVRQTAAPHKDFQPNVMRALRSGDSEYFIFAVDDIVITDTIDARQGISALQKTGAYGFFYRLGKEIDYDYMLDMSIKQPGFMQVDEDVYAWIFKQQQGYWGYPTSTDVVLYKKETVLRQFEKITFSNPNQLEGEWLKVASPRRVGLCHEASRMVNIPLNLVHNSSNRNMQSMSPKDLLEAFNDNLKMDIEPLDRYLHHSAHVDYEPTFVERDPKVKKK
ncbi:MAG: glycosyltransferase family 2 protein [Verrucomicrobia bacterium]|nr:glycosyltransferase family 2 protein [Verrucomicrobiota bacterium]